jgi:ABC-type antimicrobial peptide transport system permease subunit
MNRARADFGLLVNLAQSANYKTDKVKYSKEKKELLKSLRSNFGLLMNSPIPKSRKLTIIGFMISYPMTAWLINKAYNR